MLLSAGSKASETINGNGVIISEKRNVDDCDHIHLTGSYEIVIDTGKSDSITITADENIVSHIKTIKNGETLKIGPDTAISATNRVVLHMRKNDLSRLSVFGEAYANVARVNPNTFSAKMRVWGR